MDHVILAGLIYLNGASPDAASRSAGYKQSDNGREPCAILFLSLFGLALLFAALADQFAAPVVALERVCARLNTA